jgi:hypothetical protein
VSVRRGHVPLLCCCGRQLGGAGCSYQEGGGVYEEARAGPQIRHCEASLHQRQRQQCCQLSTSCMCDVVHRRGASCQGAGGPTSKVARVNWAVDDSPLGWLSGGDAVVVAQGGGRLTTLEPMAAISAQTKASRAAAMCSWSGRTMLGIRALFAGSYSVWKVNCRNIRAYNNLRAMRCHRQPPADD